MPDDPAPQSLIIAWAVPDGARCIVAWLNDKWVVSIEEEGEVVARSEFATAREALAHAERRRSVFLRPTRQPKT
jgi:hypothetical protein